MVVAVVASALQLGFGLFLHTTPDQQGAINIAVSAVAGLVLAWQVAAEKGLALLGGVAKALIAVAAAYGAHLSPELQSSLMTLVTMGTAFFLRTQVTAPVPAAQPAGRHELQESP